MDSLPSHTATQHQPQPAPVMPPMSLSRLEALPTEIISDIASKLHTEDVLALRLTSKTAEDKTFGGFSRFYFRKKQFMLTPDSLQCLVDISNHPKLRTVLQHVILSLDKYDLDDAAFGFNPDADDSVSRARYIAYRRGYKEQALLVTTGRDHELLAQAFANLPNLDTVGIRDYNSELGWRGQEGGRWRAYGAATAPHLTGLDLLSRTVSPGHQFASRVFTTVLRALGTAGATPNNFEVILRSTERSLHDSAFYIPSYLEPTVAPVLQGLRSLLLTVEVAFSSTQRHVIRHVAPSDAFDSLSGFLLLAPNITHIRFNSAPAHRRHNTTSTVQFWKWLGAAHPDDNPFLPNLEQLDFGMMQIPSPDFVFTAVTRFGGSLKKINFRTLLLEVHDEVIEDDGRPNLWVQLLARLPALAPGLESVVVSQMSQRLRYRRRTERARVGFRGGAYPSGVVTYTVTHMRDAQQWRRTLEEGLEVQWSRPDPSDPTSQWGQLTPDLESSDSDSE
ncbi:hypothetical protein GE09DRAFT_1295505 [Coniochaeta sp. 2T2.1]|nr:hypothetical protein GE09DRAFT_1295505 [Coniochaeta sp. 2T2.1]